MSDTPEHRIFQFASFCLQETNDHPYLKDIDDAEMAQQQCAKDIREVLGKLKAVKADLEIASKAESPGDMLEGINAALAVIGS